MMLSPPAIVVEAPAAHVSNSFEFTVDALPSKVAPLFGAEGERVWAGQAWKPRFLHPNPAKDVEGAVFTVPHGDADSVWVNTIFDPPGGRVQFVSFQPGVMTAVIDIRLTSQGHGTHARVTYTRTALTSAANGRVVHLGQADLRSGPEWRQAIEAALKGGG